MSHSQILSRRLGFSTSNAPFIGGLIDYITTSYQYVKSKSFVQGEILHQKKSQVSLSPFLSITALLLGVVTNVKFEVGTITDEPLSNDLHNILLSKEDNLYTDDIDVSKVMLCLEASDALAIIVSSSLVWLSSYAGTLTIYYCANERDWERQDVSRWASNWGHWVLLSGRILCILQSHLYQLQNGWISLN